MYDFIPFIASLAFLIFGLLSAIEFDNYKKRVIISLSIGILLIGWVSLVYTIPAKTKSIFGIIE